MVSCAAWSRRVYPYVSTDWVEFRMALSTASWKGSQNVSSGPVCVKMPLPPELSEPVLMV